MELNEKMTFINNKKNIINILSIISSLILTFIMSINFAIYIPYEGYTANDYEVKLHYAIIAIIIMTPIYIYLFNKRDFLFLLINRLSVSVLALSIFISFFTFIQLKNDTEKNLSHIIRALKCSEELVQNKNVKIFIWIICTLTILSILIFISYVVNTITTWYFSFAKEYTKEEKIFFLFTFTLCFSMICYFYRRTYAGWSTVDLVYQTDTYFVYDHYYPVFSYGFDFDWDIGNGGIRHPLATVIMFPLQIVVLILSNILFWIPNIRAILYACVQVILMILSILMIKRILNSKWVYAFFVLSFPFVFYVIFIEKYPIVVFL